MQSEVRVTGSGGRKVDRREAQEGLRNRSQACDRNVRGGTERTTPQFLSDPGTR